MQKNIDYSLYLVTDSQLMTTNTLAEAVEQAILGGVTLVQLREKTTTTKDFYQQALAVQKICQKYQIPLLINDRLDIALAIDADGVHLGQNDLPAHIARKILGTKKIIGVTTKTVAQAKQAQQDGADYLGVGAMFTTATKQDTQVIDIHTLKQIRDAVDLPIVTIGGIHQITLPILQQNLVKQQIAVQGFAVVSAILAQNDIQHASQQLKTMICPVETL